MLRDAPARSMGGMALKTLLKGVLNTCGFTLTRKTAIAYGMLVPLDVVGVF